MSLHVLPSLVTGGKTLSQRPVTHTDHFPAQPPEGIQDTFPEKSSKTNNN